MDTEAGAISGIGGPKVALVHDWLTSYGGAERCLAVMHQLFPAAPIYTLVHDERNTPAELANARVHVSELQRKPGARTGYQKLLPLMPYAVEQFDLREYDLIISSSHAVAKGVLTHSRQKHLCYCYTPMRYVWDLYQTYLEHTRLSSFAERGFRMSAHYLRLWDYASAQRVDKFLAISATVRERIRHVYNREAPVVFPPVDTGYFTPDEGAGGDYFLVVSRAVPYKRLDLIVECFNYRQEKLIVVGSGPTLPGLKKRARRNIEFFDDHVSDEELRTLYRNCRALVFAAEEDFGLTPVECMSCGRPVVAYGQGGAAETVVDGRTGVLFPEQTPASLDAAIERLLRGSWDPAACRQQALRFDQRIFASKLSAAAQYLLEH